MTISKQAADAVLREEALRAAAGEHDPYWAKLVEDLSVACKGKAETHIAFLGTAMLAKSVDLAIDVFAVKARSPVPGRPPPAGAYAPRPLCENVLVPLAVELGISLGVTGRQPLNNMPYFRMIRVGDDTPIHPNARPAFGILQTILGRLADVKSLGEARTALRSFLFVRQGRHRQYDHLIDGAAAVSLDELTSMIEAFITQDSEGGKRAQAVVAGLLDVYAGNGRVDAGRINDPSRHYPGDVVVYIDDEKGLEKAFEVRDKPVSVSDVLIFAQKALEYNLREVAVVAVSPRQLPLDGVVLHNWAAQNMVTITLFYGWHQIVSQVLFWSARQGPLAAGEAMFSIHRRLIEVEVSEIGANWWAAQVQRILGR
jgi:SacI restriction endonuclease